MRNILTLASLALLAGCATVVPPTSQPAEAVPLPVAPPAPPPPAASSDWRDWPVTPGTWAYRQDARGSIALFGVREDDSQFTIRCDRSARQLHFSRKGVAPGAMTIRTSTTARSLAAQPGGGTPAYTAVALAASDQLIDAMGYSRGRFIVESAPLPVLVIPAWSEVLRVAEDCRR